MLIEYSTVGIASTAAIVGFLAAYILQHRQQASNVQSPSLAFKDFSSPAGEDDSKDSYKMVILVRTDLNMSRGKAAVQCCHACLSAYRSAVSRHPQVLSTWESDGQPKITLKADSLEQLEELQRSARAAGLTAESVRDAGRTQLAPGTKTVCAIGPGPARLINLITGHLKLY